MKIVPNKIVVLFTGLLCCNYTFAAPQPPPPAPPPFGLPIDNGIIALVVVSLVIAFHKIYYSKKASN